MANLPLRTQKKIVIVDGYSFVFRAYYSMPALSRPDDGTPVGAVYGFTSMLMRLLLDMDPSHVVVVFDSGTKNHRHEIYPKYKANRPPAPEDLIPQFPLVRDAARALNIEILEQEGYEADDIIATLARIARKNKEEVVIVSSDKDLMQLVNHHTVMYDAMRSKVIGEEEVKEKFGVMPEKMGDLLALVGDTADNIPGVPGIGPKTAAELLNTYDTLDGVIENADKIKQPKRRDSILENQESIRLSRKLVELVEDVKLEVSFEDIKTKNVDTKKLIPFLYSQNFKSLIVRAEKEFNCQREKEDVPEDLLKRYNIITINNLDNFDEVLKQINVYGKCFIYLQTNFKNNLDVKDIHDVHSIAIFINHKISYYIHINDKEDYNKDRTLFDQNISEEQGRITFPNFIRKIASILKDSSIKKVFYDYKTFLWLLGDLVDEIENVDDIMIMSYSLGAGLTNGSFGELVELYLSNSDLNLSGGIGKIRSKFEELSEESKRENIVNSAFYISKIFAILSEKLLQEKCLYLYSNVDKPLSSIVSRMERYGIKIDDINIRNFSKDLDKKLIDLSKEIYKITGCEFNIASTQQLSDVLFNKMSLKAGRKSKTGNFSTGVSVLESLQIEGHHIADLLLEWRKLYKLKTTYTDTLLKEADANRRIHTKFLVAYTSTGRFSSVSPNLQNIPIKTDLGNKIRGAFIAEEGYKLVSADYSQVELRILADIANVPSLKKAFVEGMDVHKLTASEVFDVSYYSVDSDLRRKAKIINFSIIYGVSGYGLARNLGIPMQKAKSYIDEYFKKYPEILEYMENAKSCAKKYGYVKTIMGRKCFIREAKSTNDKMFLERAAINAPIQGSNADIIRRTMVMLDNELLNGSNDRVRMLLQVHDELLFEIRNDFVDDAIKKIKNIMEYSFLRDVPLVVDFNVSNNWIKS